MQILTYNTGMIAVKPAQHVIVLLTVASIFYCIWSLNLEMLGTILYCDACMHAQARQ